MTKQTLLVTGFEPFGSCAENPSWLCLNDIPGEMNGVRVEKAMLPVAWGKAERELNALIDRFRPAAVLSFGMAGGRASLSIERVAVNLREAALPDNGGVKKDGEPVIATGPNAYFTNLPYREMKAALLEADLPAAYSLSAGAYLCNSVMYTALHRAASDMPEMLAGFVHVPYMSGQSETEFTMSLAQLRRAACVCCCTVCSHIAAKRE